MASMDSTNCDYSLLVLGLKEEGNILREKQVIFKDYIHLSLGHGVNPLYLSDFRWQQIN